MESEVVAVAQILRLFRERPQVVWDLLPPSAPARGGDIPLRDVDGAVLGYARPLAENRGTRPAGASRGNRRSLAGGLSSSQRSSSRG
jgi:hypothetical protein